MNEQRRADAGSHDLDATGSGNRKGMILDLHRVVAKRDHVGQQAIGPDRIDASVPDLQSLLAKRQRDLSCKTRVGRG